MNLYAPLAKAMFVSLCVLGSALPAMAEHSSPSSPSMNQNIVDWWDEFDQNTYQKPIHSETTDSKRIQQEMQSNMSHTTDQAVIDWWDEFETPVPQKSVMETPMTSKAQTQNSSFDDQWDWDSWQSI